MRELSKWIFNITTMQIVQQLWTPDSGWSTDALGSKLDDAQWVLVFGSRESLQVDSHFEYIRKAYPKALITSCSTSGEIHGDHVIDNSVSLTAAKFSHTQLRAAEVFLESHESHQSAGNELGLVLKGDDLQLVFVLSDGHNVNVGDLVQGLNQSLGDIVPVTGGLAGDGVNFSKTVVGLNNPPTSNKVIAIGFYGSRLKVGHGSVGGWDAFGPLRTITKSEGNILLELDGRSALDLYKEYLGDRASELPGSALLFPLSIEVAGSEQSLVRTVLAVSEEHKSMTFAGDIPEGARCRLMRANFDRIIDGAMTAAENSLSKLDSFSPELGILISCVGRKLILGQRVEEEIEEVRSVLGEQSRIAGFYSYGELSPLGNSTGCELHNQTMTITTFSES